MKNKKKMIFTFMFLVIGIKSVAATGNYTISLGSTSISKGKSTTLYINCVDANIAFKISSSNSTVATVSESEVLCEANKKTVTVSSLYEGSTTITVRPIQAGSLDGSIEFNLPTKTLVLSVLGNNNSKSNSSSTNEKKSNDATLKSLSIDGISISPEFKSDVLEYKADAKAGTDKVKINAASNDSKANVSGIGEVSVSDGANKLEVIVAAEDGTTKTYIINLNVKEFDPIKVKVSGKNYTVIRKKDDLPEVDLFEEKKIKIGEEEVAGYYNDKLKIYLVGLKDEKGNIGMYIYEPDDNSYNLYKWVTVGSVTLYINRPTSELDNFKKYNIAIKNTEVDIYKLSKNDKIGLIYGTNVATGNKGYYVYDKEEGTLARYYNEEIDKIKKKYEKTNDALMVIVGVVSVVVILIIIISMIINKKKRKRTRR